MAGLRWLLLGLQLHIEDNVDLENMQTQKQLVGSRAPGSLYETAWTCLNKTAVLRLHLVASWLLLQVQNPPTVCAGSENAKPFTHWTYCSQILTFCGQHRSSVRGFIQQIKSTGTQCFSNMTLSRRFLLTDGCRRGCHVAQRWDLALWFRQRDVVR